MRRAGRFARCCSRSQKTTRTHLSKLLHDETRQVLALPAARSSSAHGGAAPESFSLQTVIVPTSFGTTTDGGSHGCFRRCPLQLLSLLSIRSAARRPQE